MRPRGRRRATADPPAAPERAVPEAGRAATNVRAAVALTLVATTLLGVWVVRNWVAGVVRVVAVSADTVDGATAGWVLALLVWGTLAAALILAIRATRGRMGSGGLKGPAGSVPGPAADPGTFRPKASSDTRWHSSHRATVWWIAAGAIFVLGVYHGLFLPGAITWGDWGYFVNASAVRAFYPVPSLWSFVNLGAANILGGALAPVESAMGALAWIGVPYTILERLWFYLPAVVLSYSGAVLIARRLGAQSALAAGAGAFYTVNPYALILVSGGQLTVGVGYALFPWVALAGLALWSKRSLPTGIALGAVMGVQAWFDPRTAGLSVAGMVIALLVLAAGARRPLRAPWRAVCTAALVFVLAQGPWLVPALLAVPPNLPAGYTTASALQTFSLMSLADGLTVFHPFWPTMQFIALHSVPVLWLLVPVIVGVALARAPLSRGAQVGAAIYLVFAALVSGANMPFGAINSWLFSHVPGMDLFRDPSPYFGPAALGVVVAVAAGFSPARDAAPGLAAVHKDGPSRPAQRSSRMRRRLTGIGLRPLTLSQFVLGLGGAALVVVSAWPALSGALGHNLAPRPVPARYAELAQQILGDPAGAVLWVPSTSRFAPVSPAHPSVSAFALEGMPGAAFPSTPQGLAWLESPSVVKAILQEYDIGTVVVRDDSVAYRELSLRAAPTRAAALTSLASLPHSSKQVLPGLTVFHLDPPPYPLTAFTRMVTPPARVPGQQRTEELAVASFAAGLPGWRPVGDGNDYLHQTLAQAGISASVPGRENFLRLTVRYGAAVISRPLTSCPSEGFHELKVQYRTTDSASLTALVFSAAQGAPVAAVTLPPAAAGWANAALRFVLAPTLSTWAQHVPLTDCILEMSAQPTRAGANSSVEIRSLSLSSAAALTPNCAAAATLPSPTWCDPKRPDAVLMTTRGDTIAATVAPAPGTQLLVFWQHYNPGWAARTTAGKVLRHVQVDGWANGFLVPGAAQDTVVHVVYQPQDLVVYGYGALLSALAIVLLGGLSLVAGRRANGPRRQRAQTQGEDGPAPRR